MLTVLGGGATYAGKVLGISPANLIAYWPLSETSGTTADNAEGTAARDGTYSAGITLNAATFTSGTPAPSADGNDHINIYSDSYRDAFPALEGTKAIWIKLDTNTWTDGLTHWGWTNQVDGANRTAFRKESTNNRLNWIYREGNTERFVVLDSVTSTGWLHMAMTWSAAAGAMKAYFNGAQTGSNQTVSGAFTGSLAATTTTLFAANTSGTTGWTGYLAHAAVWNTPLSAAQILALATV